MPLAERSREHYGIAPRDRHPLRPGLVGDVGGHGERQLGGGDWSEMKWGLEPSPGPQDHKANRDVPNASQGLLSALAGHCGPCRPSPLLSVP